MTAVVTSLPELVTVLVAVRIGALTLAVGNIIGGNSFDVLFVAAADVAFRGGSIYHAIDAGTSVVTLVVLLTAVLAAGLVRRQRDGIGFEGIVILSLYALVLTSPTTHDWHPVLAVPLSPDRVCDDGAMAPGAESAADAEMARDGRHPPGCTRSWPWSW